MEWIEIIEIYQNHTCKTIADYRCKAAHSILSYLIIPMKEFFACINYCVNTMIFIYELEIRVYIVNILKILIAKYVQIGPTQPVGLLVI